MIQARGLVKHYGAWPRPTGSAAAGSMRCSTWSAWPRWRASVQGVLARHAAALLLACSAGQLRISPLSAALAALAVNVLIAATVVVRRRDPVAAFAAAALLGAAQLVFGLQPDGGEPPVRALELINDAGFDPVRTGTLARTEAGHQEPKGDLYGEEFHHEDAVAAVGRLRGTLPSGRGRP
jgi:hypothetical protein